MRFDLLSDYTIPYLHPLAVHFPLVLLLLAALAAAAYAATGRPLGRQAALVFLLAGTAGAWWAEETGEALEHDVEGEPMAVAILDTHEAMAEWTLRLGLLASVAAAGATLALRRRAAPRADAAARPGAARPGAARPGAARLAAARLDAAPTREPLWARALVLLPAAAAAALVAWTAHLGGLMVWGVPVGGAP